MSDEGVTKVPNTAIAVIGDGCAGLSFAAKAASLPEHTIHLFSPQSNSSKHDHVWGYWKMDWMKFVAPLAFKTWYKWSIITANTEVEMQACHHPYQAVKRHNWLAHCRNNAKQNGVKFSNDMLSIDDFPNEQVFDSRPPKWRANMMVQHFIGWEVRAEAGSFNDDCAILMDFRCDQSRGVHFIYCLPFSDREALVESTLISPNIEQDEFYEGAISTWLSDCAGVKFFEVLRCEKGAIPLGLMQRHDPDLQGVGSNCGAIRPSSGYAFSFIQKQIATALNQVKNGNKLSFSSPHKKIDLFMDRVFLSVLRNQPHYAPTLFTRMATRLTGDEFAQFLSGEANIILRLKVIMAMPPWPFIRALLRLETVS
jgi:lycopene beta-cyclase